MQMFMSNLRRVAARLSPGRAVLVAMLLGPVVGAFLAFGAVSAEEANTVTIDNFSFTPAELTVAVGTTVKFINRDDIPHTVVDKNIAKIADKTKALKSKALDTDDSYSYTFASAGTFDYFCSLHPHMQGKIIVK
jgi:amicyanin